MSSSNSGFLDSLFPSKSSTSPVSTSTGAGRRDGSTVRSRTRRRVSLNISDGDNNTDEDGGGSRSTGTMTPVSRGATPSPHPSRRTSPLPLRGTSRASEASTSRGGQQQRREPVPMGGLSLTGSGQLNFAETSRAAVDLLDSSWSSLQGLASTVLGSDAKRPTGPNGSVKGHTRRKPSRPDANNLRSTSRSIPPSWGPSGPSTTRGIGAESEEERRALLQAKKREALLSADTDVISDLAGRHKRRVSNDRGDQSAVDPEQDQEALVYIHNVQPTDTISGVAIRYGCQVVLFRKANGFWANDSIQSRKTVLLPVESCTVKGRPIPRGESVNLLRNGHFSRDPSEDMDTSSITPSSVQDADNLLNEESPSDTKYESEGDRTWKHESWVLIDGFSTPVEIGRVPRSTLGFFPRTRRKSVSRTRSRSPSESSQNKADFPVTGSPKPQTTPSRPGAGMAPPKKNSRHHRQRSSIHLSEPGVGTLNSDAITPGPAPDKLSRFFAQHMPNLAPPAAPSPSLQRVSFESASTPTSSTSASLDNVGGMLEGWVRTAAKRAKSNIDEWQQRTQLANSRDYVSGFSGGISKGDLIELDSRLDARYNNNNTNNHDSSGNAPASSRVPRDADSARSRSFQDTSSSSSLTERINGPSSATSRTRASNVRSGLKDD